MSRPARTLAVIALGLGLAACSRPAPQKPVGRFDAVKATASSNGRPETWCDAYFPESSAPRLVLPKVVAARSGVADPAQPADRWVWINVWATWCAPCRREMPLLARWQRQLAQDGAPVDLWYLSVDARAQDLAQVLAGNADLAPGVSLRLAADRDLEPWLRKYQKDPVTTIPLQVLAGPGGKVRCIRAGALADGDYPEIRALLQ